ncbi:unnamed protein product, partial [Ectocarpus sp. 13 AM-2016]
LRVELWDWDRGSCDESLGSVEVSIDKQLRSQKVGRCDTHVTSARGTAGSSQPGGWPS